MTPSSQALERSKLCPCPTVCIAHIAGIICTQQVPSPLLSWRLPEAWPWLSSLNTPPGIMYTWFDALGAQTFACILTGYTLWDGSPGREDQQRL